MVRESFRRAIPHSLSIDCVVRLRRDLDRSDTLAARDELGRHWRKVAV